MMTIASRMMSLITSELPMMAVANGRACSWILFSWKGDDNGYFFLNGTGSA